MGGGSARPPGVPCPSPGPWKRPPAWSQSARLVLPRDPGCWVARVTDRVGPHPQWDQGGLGGPATISGARGGVWGGHSRPRSRVGGPPSPWTCSLDPFVPRSCVLRVAKPVLGEGVAGGGASRERGRSGEGALLHQDSSPLPQAVKPRSLSITLLRINFVEIKIGLGINLASRIFSGALGAAKGSDVHSQSWCRLGFQGHQRPPHPLQAVTTH